MSGEKRWLDGEPFYCETCGLGYGEFMACELPDCKLESREAAQKRKADALLAERSKP